MKRKNCVESRLSDLSYKEFKCDEQIREDNLITECFLESKNDLKRVIRFSDSLLSSNNKSISYSCSIV